MENKREKISRKNIYISNNPSETKQLGERLGNFLKKGDIIALNGDLGAGKTSFIQGITCGLNINKFASSPSFSIIKEYSGRLPIYHFDLYRLDCPEEIENLGYEEYFYGDGITLIEWAKKIKYYLPKNILLIEVRMGKEYFIRKFIFLPIGKRYEKLMEEFNNIDSTRN
jgi:tRNA threonylcarbamoyladenosine biosynthesis protein TsaE